eukprot:scaffold105208_cov57-Phaeocystis_antarctica.AAC.2
MLLGPKTHSKVRRQTSLEFHPRVQAQLTGCAACALRYEMCVTACLLLLYHFFERIIVAAVVWRAPRGLSPAQTSIAPAQGSRRPQVRVRVRVRVRVGVVGLVRVGVRLRLRLRVRLRVRVRLRDRVSRLR